MGAYMATGATAINGGFGLLTTGLNNALAAVRERDARLENYQYGEMSADEADKRTRSLYNDLYSPQAQLNQIKNAGLSPSLFYGDGGGISGQTGAQGTGASGVNPTTFGMPNIDVAQIAKLNAETENIKANTNKVNEEITGQNIENSILNMARNKGGMEAELLSMNFTTSDGGETSLFEIANGCNNYFDFIKESRKAMERGHVEYAKSITTTQYGMATLRDIYYDAKRLNKDIAVLNNEQTSAEFEKSVTDALNDTDFAHLNAEEAVQALRTQVATNTLTEVQKEAWNRVLEDLSDASSHKADWRDIVIVLAMIFNNAMKNTTFVNRKYNNTTIIR